MTQREIRTILDDAARERIPDDLNLLPRITAHYEKQKGHMMKPKIKFALAVVLALVFLAVISFTVPPVSAAVRRVLNYIPGLALVEQGVPLRVLAGPVSMEREGVRLIVEKGTSDEQFTILLIHAEKIGPQSGMQPCPTNPPLLRLPNGDGIPVKESTEFGHDTGYTQRLVFNSLPKGTEDVVLELPCLWMVMPDVTPENWQIPLVFEPARDLKIAPVIELPPAPATETGMPFGIAMTLEKAVTLEDGYILTGSMSWTDARLGDYAVNAAHPMLVDANGNPVPFEFVAPDASPEPGSKRSFWAIKVPGKEHAWPLKLRQAANITLNLPDLPSFTLDLSSPPGPGESKDINKTVEAGGYPLKVLRFTTQTDPQGNATMKFFIQSDPDVVGVGAFDLENAVLGGGGGGGGGGGDGGGGGGSPHGPIEAGFTYNGPLPTGEVQIGFSMLMLNSEGGWTITWQP